MACAGRNGSRSHSQTSWETVGGGILIICHDLKSPDSQNRMGSSELCAWARKVNSSWIVHSDLDRHAEEYLAHLESSDPLRLELSCENARALVKLRDPFEDPKAWFYAGLFSLATPEELDRF